MNRICVFFALICLIALISACEEPTRETRRMDEAWRLMESAPDSSLMILDSINTLNLRKDKEKARYALLKSMALDKNVIDTTTFDVLQPAIDYYPKHGTPDEKLRTYYYQGRIHQNTGRNDEAMRAFVNGLFLRNYKDTLTLARTYASQGRVFKLAHDYQNYSNNMLLASELFYKKGYYFDYADCLTSVLNGKLLMDNIGQADSIKLICDQAYAEGWLSKEDYIPHQLTYYEAIDSISAVKTLLEECSDMRWISTDCMLAMGNSYLFINQPQKAYDLLLELSDSEIVNSQLKYYAIMVSVLESLGKYKEALDIYHDYSNKEFEIEAKAYEQKLQWINERFELEIEMREEMIDKADLKTRHLIIGLILLIIICFLACSVYIVRTRRAIAEERERIAQLRIEKLNIENELLLKEQERAKLEKENLEHKINEVEEERDRFSSLLKRTTLSDEVRHAIKEWVEMLNAVLATEISGNDKYERPYNAWLEKIRTDRKAFMNTIRLALTASHPEFIQYFIDKKLTTDEINYVCLYAIGMIGKEVGIFMNMRSHVNISSAIRQKLGINKNETNLGIYVRKLLKEL